MELTVFVYGLSSLEELLYIALKEREGMNRKLPPSTGNDFVDGREKTVGMIV
jgi:hypothetical protein